MKYFNNITSLDELKKAYRRLAMKYHPDCGGSEEIMKQINAEHDALFETLKASHNKTADEYHQTTETAEEFRDIITALLKLEAWKLSFAVPGSGSAGTPANTRTRSKKWVAVGATTKSCGTGGTRSRAGNGIEATGQCPKSARSTVPRPSRAGRKAAVMRGSERRLEPSSGPDNMKGE